MDPFQVMSEPVRRRIVQILASGEHTAGNVAAVVGHEFGITRQAVSKQLQVLRESYWVVSEPDESTRLYRLDPEALGELVHEVNRLKYLWARRIGSREGNPFRPEHVVPFELTTRAQQRAERARQRVREKRGLRGSGRKDDPWVNGARSTDDPEHRTGSEGSGIH